MYQEDLDEAKDFAMRLPELRRQVSDQGLLDRCQMILDMLLQQMADSDVQLGARPEPEAMPAQ